MDIRIIEPFAWIWSLSMLALCVFFISTCSVHLNEVNMFEKRNKLEADNGKSISNSRPSHWSYKHPREVEEGVLQPE